MQYIVVDLEASCWEAAWVRQRMETIEIGAVRLDDTLAVVDEFDAFVRPVGIPRLSSFCTKLTSITQDQVDAADTFPTVLAQFRSWMGRGPYRLTSWGVFDITQIHLDCERHDIPFPENFAAGHLDLKSAFAKWQRIRPCGMEKALARLDLPLTGHHHRGIDDARNLARIAQQLIPHLAG
jgi:3'-5' exoribonuclease 1